MAAAIASAWTNFVSGITVTGKWLLVKTVRRSVSSRSYLKVSTSPTACAGPGGANVGTERGRPRLIMGERVDLLGELRRAAVDAGLGEEAQPGVRGAGLRLRPHDELLAAPDVLHRRRRHRGRVEALERRPALVNASTVPQSAMKLARRSSLTSKSSFAGVAGASPDGSLMRSSCAVIFTLPVLCTSTGNGTPAATALGNGDAGEMFSPATRAAGVTVKRVSTVTPGLGAGLFGVNVTVSVLPLAAIGAGGPSILTLSRNAWAAPAGTGAAAPPAEPPGGRPAPAERPARS